jgi:hypothetical protein
MSKKISFNYKKMLKINVDLIEQHIKVYSAGPVIGPPGAVAP